MHWKTTAAVLACVLVCALARAQNSGREISDLLKTAIENNRELLATRQRVSEARGLLKQAGMRPNPSLQMEGGSGRPLGTRGEEEFSAGYSQPVELGGKRTKRLSVVEIAVSLAEAELAERTRQFSFEVKSRVLETIVDREKDRALERLSRVNQQAYALAEARVKEGDVAPLDAQLLLVEQNRTEAQRASLAGRLEADFVELRRLAGLDAGAAIPLGDSIARTHRDVALEQLKQTALKDRPDVRGARLLETQSKAELALTEAQSRPDVTLSARYVRRNSAFDQFGLSAAGSRVPIRDRDNVLVFGASIPLFTGRRNQGNIEAASARSAGTGLHRQHLEASIPLEVEAVYRRWLAAKNALAVFDRGIVDQAGRSLQVVREAYQLGQLRLLDVLNEQRRLAETELAYIDARAEVARTLMELERVIGGGLQ